MKINNCLDRPEDRLDPQQYILATIQGEGDETPDAFMTLKPKMSAVIRQLYGSCTAQATDAIKEFQEKKLLSHYFIYVMSKKISGNYEQEGEYLINPLKAVCKHGVPEEKFMPDVKPSSGRWIDYVKKEPSRDAYTNALEHKGETYWRVNMGINNFKNAIYQNNTPVMFAVKWYNSYNNTPNTGILPEPDRLVGYHAVCGVGWEKDGLWVKNSFGKNWGNNGYFKIMFDKWEVVQPYACYVLLTNNNKKMKIIGDKRDNKQYIAGDDKKLHWIFNEVLLETFHSMGAIDKNKVEWKDNLDEYILAEPFVLAK